MATPADDAARRIDAADPDASPIDLGPLPGYLGYNLRQAQAALFRDFARRMAGFDVTPGQFSVLTLLERNPGISQGALARVHGLDKSTLSPALGQLAARGLVARERHARDRRAYALRLTGAGTALLARVRAAVEDQERAMAAALAPAGADGVISTLRRLSRALGGNG